MPGSACDPVEPEREECIQKAAAYDLVAAFASPGFWVVNPATGTYCPPYNSVSGELSGYEEYTIELACHQYDTFARRKCVHPDWEKSIEVSPLPGCSKEWEYQGIVDTGGSTGFPDFEPCQEIQWWGNCVRSDGGVLGSGACPVGHLFFDEDDCLCHDLPCPEGECCCPGEGDVSGTCISCSPPDCFGVFGCSWDSGSCSYRCEVTPECEYNERYDYDTCSCVPCPAGECWCKETNSCVPCSPPPDADEDGCEWNTETCEWDCHDCPEGECWCETTGQCVDCSDRPECYEQLDCRWNPVSCEYVCDDPAIRCGPGRAWLPAPDCRCEAGGGADIAELHTGWLVRAWGAGAEIYVGTSRDAGATWDDVLVASDGEAGQSAPALTVDQHDTLWVAYHNTAGLGGTTFLFRSMDLGQTWEEIYTATGRTFPRPLATPERFLLCTNVSGLSFLSIQRSLDRSGAGPYGPTLHDVWLDTQERRADLRQDRRGWLHIVYETTAGEIAHRYSKDLGDTWTDPAEILAASGSDPGYHVGAERALLTYWQGGELFVATTDETYSVFSEAVAIPPTAFVAQQLGVVWDRRKHPWLVGTVDEEPEVAWAANPYVEWVEV